MNDKTKELLTLAAKAMGKEIEGWTEAGNPLVRKPGIAMASLRVVAEIGKMMEEVK